MTESEFVAVVVDPTFGARVAALAAQMPVWIAHTPVNRAAAESYWGNLGSAAWPVTTFRIAEDESPEVQCLNVLSTVLEHHGPHSQRTALRAIEVIGASPDSDLQVALEDAGFDAIEVTAVGFRASAV